MDSILLQNQGGRGPAQTARHTMIFGGRIDEREIDEMKHEGKVII